MANATSLHVRPAGVIVHRLTPHPDPRGSLTEIYREQWGLGERPVQINAVSSAAGTLRGVHVHIRHQDHVWLVAGRMTVGLHDIRLASPTAGASCMIELDATALTCMVIPVGVAHGFYFPEPSIILYGLSCYWDTSDELACRWDAPELGLTWPTSAPILSERDAAAGDYLAFVESFRRATARGALADVSPARP